MSIIWHTKTVDCPTMSELYAFAIRNHVGLTQETFNERFMHILGCKECRTFVRNIRTKRKGQTDGKLD